MLNQTVILLRAHNNEHDFNHTRNSIAVYHKMVIHIAWYLHATLKMHQLKTNPTQKVNEKSIIGY